MRLQDLEYLNSHTVAAGQSFYRIQRARRSATTVLRGPLRLAPPGLLSGRFDLENAATAYMAESPDTALYEGVFRREAMMVSLTALAQRELVALQLRREAHLGDLRPHASTWPVLQSLRHSETQELAAEAQAAGYNGLIYRSAQQFGQDCVVLFDPPTDSVKRLWQSRLVNSLGAVSRWVADAVRGSCVTLVP